MNMRNTLCHFFVEGVPQAQARPRKGKYGNIYSPAPANGWKEAIQATFLQKCGRQEITEPVFLTIHFFFPKKGVNPHVSKPHTSRPDKDNLEKVIMDALNKLAWKDDSQVFGSRTAKYWSSTKCGAEIWIETIELEVML